MKIVHARVSTADQHLRMQEDTLKSAGSDEIFTDVVSSAKSQRPGLDKALEYVHEKSMKCVILKNITLLLIAIFALKHR